MPKALLYVISRGLHSAVGHSSILAAEDRCCEAEGHSACLLAALEGCSGVSLAVALLNTVLFTLLPILYKLLYDALLSAFRDASADTPSYWIRWSRPGTPPEVAAPAAPRTANPSLCQGCELPLQQGTRGCAAAA